MNRSFFLLVSGLVLALSGASFAAEKTPEIPRLMVEATADVSAKPDIAVLELMITTTESKLQRSFSRNTESSNNVIAALKQKGVKPEDIQTVSFRIDPIYEGKRKPSRYSVVHHLVAKVRNFEKLGPLLDDWVDEEVVAISQIVFQVENPYPFEQSARIKAAKLAREKATDLAIHAGAKLGRVLLIREGVLWPEPIMRTTSQFKAMGDMASEVAAAPQLEPGQIKFSVTCHAEYALEI